MSDEVESLAVDLLVKELSEVAEWYTLGAFLGLTENEIKEIEQDHDGTARRRMAMLNKWFKKETNPSWLKIISALERMSEMSLANQLREKYTCQPVSGAVIEPQTSVIASEDSKPMKVMEVSREDVVVRELEETEEKYLKLIVDTESAMEDINPSKVQLRRFSGFYTGVRVTTVEELFNHLEQSCFLDYTLLQKIISFFLKKRAQFIVDDLGTYIEDLKNFKTSITMREFLENIEKAQNPLTTTNGGMETCTVVLHLVGGWLEKTMNDLDKLLKELFQNKRSVLSHIQIVKGSIIVTYSAPQCEAKSLMNLVLRASLPLRLVGVCGLTVAGIVVLATENEPFSFEFSLFEAIGMDKTNLLSFLLNINTTPDATMDKVTALCAAIRSGNHKAVQILLQAGANPDLYGNDRRMTPLFIATGSQNHNAIEFLLKANADPNLQDGEGRTPLHLSSYLGNSRIVDHLLKFNSNPNLQSRYGATALYLACFKGHFDVASSLLRANANPNLATNDGLTPLNIASYEGKSNIVRILLDANADPNIATLDGTAPLHIATKHGHFDIVNLLLSANADNNHHSDKTVTPLMFACWNNRTEIARLLLSRGVDPNIQHSKGNITALMCACLSGCLDSVELLLMYGADPSVVTTPPAPQRTALQLAANEGHEDIVHLIQAVELSQSSTTLPILTVKEIVASTKIGGISNFKTIFENMLVTKSENLISSHFKNVDKAILPKQSQETPF